MRTIEEINDARNNLTGDEDQRDINSYIFDSLIEMTEHIRTLTQDGITGDIVTIDDPTVKAIERAAMIRFGEWVINNLYIEEDGKNDRLLSAVMGRLTQGGDL